MSLPDVGRTIVALATPPGKGALAILRLTGCDSFRIFAKISSKKYSSPKHKQVGLVRIYSGKTHIDDAVVIFFKAPNSYTGEDTVEIMCHGSPYIQREILNAAISAGASPAAPGEFTLRAFLNGKMDLAQSEAVNALISSDSAAAAHAALAQSEGQISELVGGFKDRLLSMLAGIEVNIDNSDGDIEDLDYDSLLDQTLKLRQDILSAAKGFKAGKNIREGIRTVLAGAPNAGKSSLLNAILGYDRAIVSPQAGTTRDVLEASLEYDGIKIIFADTAGLSAKPGDCIEQKGMERAISALRQTDIVLLLKDSSCPSGEADRIAERQAMDNMPEGAELIRVCSKSDIAAKNVSKKRNALYVSALSGDGIDGLLARITEKTRNALDDNAAPATLFARHYSALKAAAEELDGLEHSLRNDPVMPEILAEHIRVALNSLGLITGETVPDDVLERIFSQFCVGK